jgi:uncharacterized phiE125 gp8 family phage protein
MAKSYGLLRLTETSPAQTFTEPLTVAEVQTYLNLPTYSPADTSLDTQLESFIRAARETAELYQGRDLVAKQWDLLLDEFPADEIVLRQDVSTVDLMQYTEDDSTTTTMTVTTDYIVDLQRGLILPPVGGSFPSAALWPSSAVLARFTVSPRAMDEHIKIGMLMLVAAWHEGRLPFEPGASMIREFPFAVTANLSYGKVYTIK